MKLIAKLIIIVAIFYAGFYLGSQQALSPTNGSSLEGSEKIIVDLVLDFGEEDIRSFDNIELKEDISVFGLLQKVTSENDLELGYKDYGSDLGVLVESISNITNNPVSDLFWNYWVNDTYAEIGASNYYLENGDIVKWKYVPNPFNS